MRAVKVKMAEERPDAPLVLQDQLTALYEADRYTESLAEVMARKPAVEGGSLIRCPMGRFPEMIRSAPHQVDNIPGPFFRFHWKRSVGFANS